MRVGADDGREPSVETTRGTITAARTATEIATSATGLMGAGCGFWMLRRIFSRRCATLSSTSVTAWQWLHWYSLVSSLVNWALPQVEQVSVTVLIVVCLGVILGTQARAIQVGVAGGRG